MNPWIAVFPFALFIICIWATTQQDRFALILSVLVGSFLAQSHAGFVLPVAALWAVALIASVHCGYSLRVKLVAVALLVVCWTPVAYDQLFGRHNISLMMNYFLHAAPIGLRAAVGITSRELSGMAPWLGYSEPRGDMGLVITRDPVDLLIAIAPFVMAALAAWRRGVVSALTLQAIVGLLSVVGVLATSRSDVATFYLLRWWWVVAMYWWLSVVWSALAAALNEPAQRAVALCMGMAAVLISIDTFVTSSLRVPETTRDEAAMRAVVPTLIEAVNAQGARSATITTAERTDEVVSFADALVLQLEKHGVRVALPGEGLNEQKFGKRRIGDASPGSLGVLLASDESPSSAVAAFSGSAQLKQIWPVHHDSSVAVFTYPVFGLVSAERKIGEP